MVSIILPPGSRRTALRSFWLVIGLIFGAGIWCIAWILHLPFPWFLGLIAAVALVFLVYAQEIFVRRLYHAWNRRLVRPLAIFVSKAVMGICLFIIFVATGRTGSRLRLNGAPSTTWQARNSLPAEAYGFPFVSQGRLSGKSGWIRGYIQWAIRSGNSWSISLIPFICFLRMLASDEQKSVEANIYTLF